MSRTFQISKEHEIFCSLMQCPLCNQFPIIPTYFKHNRIKIRRNTPISDMDISTVAQCPRCKQSWSVFNTNSSNSHNNPTPSTQNTPPNTVHSRDVLEVSKFQIIEASREEEALGSDRRTIDNSRGSGSITRKLTLTKEWSKTYTIDFQKAVKTNIAGDFSILKLLTFKSTIEGDLRKKYSISETVKNVYTDEVAVTIEPRSKAVYNFDWKRIWQKGTIKCLDQVDQVVAFIPFKVVVEVTFDIIAE